MFVGGLGLSWQLSFGILVLLYFYSHYFFASGAAHIGAMFTAFLSVPSALGTPPYFGAMVLAFLYPTLWVALPTTVLGQHPFSMVPIMYLLPNGGVMDSSYPWSILLSGLELEEFGGSSLIYGLDLAEC